MTNTPRANRLRHLGDYLGLLLVLAALLVYFHSRSQYFLTRSTLVSIANGIPDLLVIATGMTLVLIAGGIDLSVGSVMALAASVLGLGLTRWNLPVPLAVLAAVAVGAGCGAVNGLLSVGWRVPSFIVTLGMLEIARGAAYLATDSQTVYLGPRVEAVGRPLPGLGLSPAFLAAVAVVAVAQVVLARTVFGRYVVAVGTNEEAVRLSGVDPRPTKVAVFVLAGLLAAVGGWFSTARMASADPNGGVGLELSAIAAAVIGGTSLLGGRGSAVGTFLGVLIIAVLQTGLTQTGTTEPAKRVITGVVIVLAAITDAYRARHTGNLRRLFARLASWRRPQTG